MSATATIGSPASTAEPTALSRYFEISLYLLLLVSVLSLVSTGKLDLVSIVLAPAALLAKGYRWWRGREPELSNRTATFLVVFYFLYFPIDLWWVSRMLSIRCAESGPFCRPAGSRPLAALCHDRAPFQRQDHARLPFSHFAGLQRHAGFGHSHRRHQPFCSFSWCFWRSRFPRSSDWRCAAAPKARSMRTPCLDRRRHESCRRRWASLPA